MNHPKYNVPESTRRARVKALEAAKWSVNRDYFSGDIGKTAAAKELLAYGFFKPSQLAKWFGLTNYSLGSDSDVVGWGITSLAPEQFDIAIELAKAGIAGEKPKTTIHKAYEQGMTFDAIGGLLCQHKNTIRRIIRRIQGEPWS